MKTYIKTILFTLLLGVVTLGFAPTLQAATTTGGGDYGLTATAVASGLKSYGKDLPTLVGNIIGTALAMIGVFFFILVTYGGILWMTARPRAIEAGRMIVLRRGANGGHTETVGRFARPTREPLTTR